MESQVQERHLEGEEAPLEVVGYLHDSKTTMIKMMFVISTIRITIGPIKAEVPEVIITINVNIAQGNTALRNTTQVRIKVNITKVNTTKANTTKGNITKVSVNKFKARAKTRAIKTKVSKVRVIKTRVSKVRFTRTRVSKTRVIKIKIRATRTRVSKIRVIKARASKTRVIRAIKTRVKARVSKGSLMTRDTYHVVEEEGAVVAVEDVVVASQASKGTETTGIVTFNSN